MNIENIQKENQMQQLLLEDSWNFLKEAIFDEERIPVNPWNRRKRGPDQADTRRKRNRSYALEEMKELTDSLFILMFRLSRPAFYSLLSLITLCCVAFGI